MTVKILKKKKKWVNGVRSEPRQHWRFADSVDQDQTAQNVMSDLRSTLFNKKTFFFFLQKCFT